MSNETNRLSDAFDTLLAEPMPDSTVDLNHVLGEGRRRLRRRRTVRALAGAAVVGLVCTLVPLLGTDRATGTVTPASTPTTGSDPVTVAATFGWLPVQLSVVQYEHQGRIDNAPDTSSSAYARLSKNGDDIRNAHVDLLTETAGTSLSGSTKGMQDIGLVNGHRAYWQRKMDPTSGKYHIMTDLLYLQSPAGQWASLETTHLSQEETLRIARSVVFGARSLPLPFRLTGMLDPTDLDNAQITTDNGRLVEAAAVYELPGGDTVMVSAQPPDATVPLGAPSAKSATASMNGTYVRVTVDHIIRTNSPKAITSTYAPPTGPPAADYLAHITSFGMNPADWTTSVIVPAEQG